MTQNCILKSGYYDKFYAIYILQLKTLSSPTFSFYRREAQRHHTICSSSHSYSITKQLISNSISTNNTASKFFLKIEDTARDKGIM